MTETDKFQVLFLSTDKFRMLFLSLAGILFPCPFGEQSYMPFNTLDYILRLLANEGFLRFHSFIVYDELKYGIEVALKGGGKAEYIFVLERNHDTVKFGNLEVIES